jgi:nucleotide-binding universal stress UspA family protein
MLDLIAGHPRTGGVPACKGAAEVTTLRIRVFPNDWMYLVCGAMLVCGWVALSEPRSHSNRETVSVPAEFQGDIVGTPRLQGDVRVSFRRILLAVDESPVAAHAVDVGLELAKALGAELAFIFVVDRSQTVIPESGVPAADLIALAEQDGKRLLAMFRMRSSREPPALEFVAVGQPAAEIVKTANEWHADVIVMGSHGRRGVERALMGSVAEAVMRHAPCSVLVVRAPA